MKEREISILDLFFYILLRWRSILVAMLIGAVVLGGFGYMRSYQAYKTQTAQVEEAKKQLEEMLAAGKDVWGETGMPELDQITMEWLEERMTDAQLQNIRSVLSYEQMYEEKLAYGEESVWLQAESALQQKAELTFQVTADSVEQAYSMEKVYEDVVTSGELAERLAAQLGTSTAVVEEIYGLTRSSKDLVEGTDTFKVSVAHYDKAMCDKLVDIVVEFVREKCDNLQITLGAHGITVVNQSVAELVDTELLTWRSQYYEELVELQTKIAKTKDTFSIREVQYYDLSVNGAFTEVTLEALETLEKAEADSAQKTEETPADIVARGVTVTPGISLKYVILGMILGTFLLVFWYFVRYILNGRICADDNLQELYNIPHLGQIKCGNVDKTPFGFVDKFIISLRDIHKRSFSVEESIELAVAAIKMAAGKKSLDTVYLIGCDLKGHTLKLCQQIKERLGKDNIQVEILSNILYDAQAMCDLQHAKGIALVETIGSTLYSEITQEVELLHRQGICVLGGILVE